MKIIGNAFLASNFAKPIENSMNFFFKYLYSEYNTENQKKLL